MPITAHKGVLLGRRIVGFDLRTWRDSDPDRSLHHDPVFILDNGARVTFAVSETYEGDGYGVTPLYHPLVEPTGNAEKK